MVDICGFLARTGISGVDLQKKLDVSSGLLSNYKAGKANPSYSMLLKLLQEGMTIEEMFGHEIWEQVKKQAALDKIRSIFPMKNVGKLLNTVFPCFAVNSFQSSFHD